MFGIQYAERVRMCTKTKIYPYIFECQKDDKILEWAAILAVTGIEKRAFLIASEKERRDIGFF